MVKHVFSVEERTKRLLRLGYLRKFARTNVTLTVLLIDYSKPDGIWECVFIYFAFTEVLQWIASLPENVCDYDHRPRTVPAE